MKKTQETIRHFMVDNAARFSKETVRSYQLSLRQFFEFCVKEYDEVVAQDIRRWLSSLGASGLKPRSICVKLACLKSFYKYCLEENQIVKNPTARIQRPRLDDSLPKYLEKADLAKLFEQSRHDPRDRAIIETLYVTGVRISELLNIRLEDIKWDTRQIWIKKGKGNRERFVLMTTECAERLKTYLKTRGIDSPYLFANQRKGKLSRVWVEHRFRIYSKQLSLNIPVTPHTLRHTFAAHLIQKGMPQTFIQELLGHENVNSTRIYTRLSDAARKKQYDSYQ
ncbi:tyrosine-type recombinase/integrase [Heliobacillus mobilis]|uniref:Tyrosine-type recombinase/integrase n=1 Tax=Heliobacterium mobile TaxID=28064 RepID=A0A6I3SLU6_HELMO|nr:site-specific tyrosine recombinase/integron integrase [Heliobacterium mobile]MTV49612.1 tyrosine-type recombinase/integrase [Heliobacterium mobile]